MKMLKLLLSDKIRIMGQYADTFRPHEHMNALPPVICLLVKISRISRTVKHLRLTGNRQTVACFNCSRLSCIILGNIDKNFRFSDYLTRSRYGIIFQIECRNLLLLFDFVHSPCKFNLNFPGKQLFQRRGFCFPHTEKEYSYALYRKK